MFLSMDGEAKIRIYPNSCHTIYFGRNKDRFVNDLIKFMDETGSK